MPHLTSTTRAPSCRCRRMVFFMGCLPQIFGRLFYHRCRLQPLAPAFHHVPTPLNSPHASCAVYAEFILVTTAKLFVLDRMLSVVIAGRPPSVVRNWLGAGRIMLCLLALCHLIGVGAAITTTYFASQSALLTDSFATEHNGDRYAHYDMVRCIICSPLLSLY